MSGDKSLFVAYLCWLVGGFLGLHHFYLRRDKHAFITFATIGGYFGCGVIRDLWRLPEYVRDANNDLYYLEKLYADMKAHKRPPSSIVRQSGLMILGNLFAYLVEYALPADLLEDYGILPIIKLITIPFASAVGVWLAGNVGRHQGAIWKPLLAAYIAALPSLFYGVPVGSFSTIAAALTFNRYSKKWRVCKPKPGTLFKRIVIYLVCVTIYLSLWACWCKYGCTIEDPDTGDKIRCTEAYDNFVNSPAYQDLANALWMLYERVRHQGLMDFWKEMMQTLDVSGKGGALAVLELADDASPEEILAAYKKLSRQYHPDKEKDPSKKAEKQEKFIQVQEAYAKLQSSTKRYKMQKQNEDAETHDEL